MAPAFSTRQITGHTALGVLALALVTVVCFALHANLAIPSFLYLLVVVLQSLTGGFAIAASSSVLAVLCLDFFFTPPVLRLNIDDPVDAVALLTFLLTSLVITRLASKARMETLAAQKKRRDLACLYETAWRLLSLESDAAAGAMSLRIFREVFELNAACLLSSATGEVEIEGQSAHGLAEKTQLTEGAAQECDDPVSGVYTRRLVVAGRLVGAVGFEGLADAESTVGPLAMLAAAALDRARAFRTASEAAAATQTETLRSAIVDAFAHQFKTPLTAILAAAGGIRAAGSLAPQQLEMTEMIEGETIRLDRLASRVLRMARLDRDEVKPQLEATDLFTLVARVVDQCRVDARDITIDSSHKWIEVASDPELLTLAVSQLLDNAFKYSPPRSAVAVAIDSDGEVATVRVRNAGDPIPPDEQARIFERFYRGAQSGAAARGSGLGLYVARKIVVAHGGTLDLDRQDADGASTTFSLKLPILKRESHYERKAG